MMRVRKLSAVFWSTCVIAFVFILYVMTDLSLKLPSIKPAIQDLDDTKWSDFESKLRQIEQELNQHNAYVGEIKSAVDQIVDRNQGYRPPQNRKKATPSKNKPMRTVGDLVRTSPKHNITCPLLMETTPNVNVQMLSMYERIMFDDKDGGVWKQGWNVEYKDEQWSSRNKLKVFIVPHSHNDPGWIKTFENYYKTQTKAIFNNMVEKLNEKPGRKFIWAEISFLSMWWKHDATDADKAAFKKLLHSGQIEIVTGGWVMNDEANSHWISIAQQLTTGHQWLIKNLDYTPRSGWAIDPFGHSATQPYLLKQAGLKNSVIQRVHYRVKKELAQNKQLEFKWRQLWDSAGKTDMFTHMMPFYSYDVPHTCGPDPKVCCQFDFKRLPGNGVNCPWGIPPRKIIQKNVEERSYLILDQWRKKAQLYRSNVVLVPLGDDFRYDRANEWDNQYQNYEMIIDYINNNDRWNAEIQFGTLEDYFKALHAEVAMSEFPVLSGDMFTYADRNEHYWSGYYTSRPFYKSMDRVLLSYVRAAEIISAQATTSKAVTRLVGVQLRDRAQQARETLALFQHHDGITGTSRDEVREDYAKKMVSAIKLCQSAIQQAAYFILKQPPLEIELDGDVFFEVDDVWNKHDDVPERITITLDEIERSRRLVLYNALLMRRTEIVTVIVSTPHVEVYDPEGNPILSQVSPVVAGEKRLALVSNKFQLTFPAVVEPLSLTVYTISMREITSINKFTSYAKVRVYNADYWNIELPEMFAVEVVKPRLAEDLALRVGAARAVLDRAGLLKALVTPGGTTVPVHMDFVQYDSVKSLDNNSGAYLFIPSGPALTIRADPFPEIVVVEGIHQAALYTVVNSANTATIFLTMALVSNPSLAQSEVHVESSFRLDPAADDLELAVRFSTAVRNGDVFYTDLNGMQMIKRRYFHKLPVQANFYPLPSAAYIEDESTRFTILTSSPLGMAALAPGQIEVVQDRRLSRDDNRGLSQGIQDNVHTRHRFRVIVENANSPCPAKSADHPSGSLSLGAHVSHQMLLQPLVPMHYSISDDALRSAYSPTPYRNADVVLGAMNAFVTTKNKDGKLAEGIGLTFHRVHLDTCYGNKEIANHYTIGNGQINLSELADLQQDKVFETSLTFTRLGNIIPAGEISLCPMEVRSAFVNQTFKQG